MKTFKEYINEIMKVEAYIMNASTVWSTGKISKKTFKGQEGNVIFLGTKGKTDIAIIASHGKTGGDPFENYNFKKGERIKYAIDTGNDYKRGEDLLILNSFVKIDNEGNIVGEYEDKSYSFWVFK